MPECSYLEKWMHYRKRRVIAIGLLVIGVAYAGVSFASTPLRIGNGEVLSTARVSQTGFDWWRDFSRKRREIRKEALRCVMGQHTKRCWATLAVRLNAQARVSSAARVGACPIVRKNLQGYWLHLSKFAALSAQMKNPRPRQGEIARMGKRLHRVKRDLREMADLGQCPSP